MPTVPIEQNRVGLAGVTDEKLRPGDYGGSGLQAAGAGMETLGRALGGVAGDQLIRAEQRQRDRAAAEDAALKQSYNAYDARARALLRDGGAAFYAQAGQVAVDAADGISATLRQIPDEIGKTLQPHIRALFDHVIGQRVGQDIAGVQDHADAEKRVWQEQQAEQLMAASARNALDHIGTPLFADHVATGLKAIDDRAAVQRWDPTVKLAAEQHYVSGIHKRAIDGLTVGDAIMAESYYHRHSAEMTPQDRSAIEDSLRGPLLERQGAAVIDGYGNLVDGAHDGLASPYAPRTVDLPAIYGHIEQQDLPDAVKRSARTDAGARATRNERRIEQEQHAARDAAFVQVDDLGDAFISVSQLSPEVLRGLDIETLDALKRQVGVNATPGRIEPHGETAHELAILAATDRQAFAKRDLRLDRARMTPDEYAAMSHVQQGWRSDPPAIGALMHQRVWEAARRSDPTGDEQNLLLPDQDGAAPGMATHAAADQVVDRIFQRDFGIPTAQSRPTQLAAKSLLSKGVITTQDVEEATWVMHQAMANGAYDHADQAFLNTLNDRVAIRSGYKARAAPERSLQQSEIGLIQRALPVGLDLKSVRIVRGSGGSAIAAVAFSRGHPAITIGNTVYLDSGEYSPDLAASAKGIRTLIHELNHVRQYQRYGMLPVFGRIGRESAVYGEDGAYNYFAHTGKTMRVPLWRRRARLQEIMPCSWSLACCPCTCQTESHIRLRPSN